MQYIIVVVVACVLGLYTAAYAHDMHVLKTCRGVCYTANNRAVLIKRDELGDTYCRLWLKFKPSTISHRGFAFSAMRAL